MNTLFDLLPPTNDVRQARPERPPHNGTSTSRAGAALVEATGTAATQTTVCASCFHAAGGRGLTRAELMDMAGKRLPNGITEKAACANVHQRPHRSDWNGQGDQASTGDR